MCAVTSPSFVFVYVLSFMLFNLAANTLVQSSSAGEISEASLVGVLYSVVAGSRFEPILLHYSA